MQGRARSSGAALPPVGGRASQHGQAQTPNRARAAARAVLASDTLRRAGQGSILSADQPSTPPSAPSGSSTLNASGTIADASASLAASIGGASAPLISSVGGEALPATPPEDVGGGSCGLTPASLKHLRRQNAKLTEEKEKLAAEIERCQVVIRELRERIAALEEQLREGEIREDKLKADLDEARQREEAERKRADEAERLNLRLEESLATKEAEVARLRQALEDQLLLTKEVCEAAERSSNEAQSAAKSAEEIARLNEQVKVLKLEKDTLAKDRERFEREHAEQQQRTAMAMAAAEKAMAMHASHVQRVEQLRTAKLAEAIQHKVDLHISVPRVTLSYNNAPPLVVSAASALGDDRIRGFLDAEVFSHFEPLWVSLDSLDSAPDGTSKKAYSTRMLDRLTEAVKGFVEKSQRSEADGGLTPSVREDLGSSGPSPAQSGDGDRASRSGQTEASIRPATGGGGPGGGGAGTGGAAARRRPEGAPAGGACAMNSIQEVDRERLLGLLRSGDDRGLDSKLKELLQSRA